MGGSHGSSLYLERGSWLHGLAPQVKVVAAVATVFAVVCTPRTAVWAFGLDAVIVVALVRLARLPVAAVLGRLAFELPFVAFALALPFVSRGERVDVLGFSLSQDGLWAAWNILAKGTLGLAVSVVLVSTTQVGELLGGLQRLRVPHLMVAIAGFMVRYGDLLVDDLHRARVARLARAHDPRWLWQAKATATSAGAMFVRAYERGERVHLAMLARGYQPGSPLFPSRPAVRRDVAVAAVVPAATIVIAAAAIVNA